MGGLYTVKLTGTSEKLTLSSQYSLLRCLHDHCHSIYTVFQKSDAKIQITIITPAYLIRIKYPLSGFNYYLSDVNLANFNKIHRTVSEQQVF